MNGSGIKAVGFGFYSHAVHSFALLVRGFAAAWMPDPHAPGHIIVAREDSDVLQCKERRETTASLCAL
jgi:hypothetical protein